MTEKRVRCPRCGSWLKPAQLVEYNIRLQRKKHTGIEAIALYPKNIDRNYLGCASCGHELYNDK